MKMYSADDDSSSGTTPMVSDPPIENSPNTLRSNCNEDRPDAKESCIVEGSTNVRQTNAEDDLSDNDNWIYCVECEDEYMDECPQHGPLHHIQDSLVKATVAIDREYATRTVPKCLRVAPSAITNALGVWTTKLIPVRSYFGPYKGVHLSQPTSKSYGWQVWRKKKNEEQLLFVDGSDPTRSNWMRYVNCARNFQEQNVIAYQFKWNVYYAVLREIPAHKELLVYFDDEYAEEFGIDTTSYFDIPKTRLPVELFPCCYCRRKFRSPVKQEKHKQHCRAAQKLPVKSLNADPKLPEYGRSDFAFLVTKSTRYHCDSCNYRTQDLNNWEKHTRTHDSTNQFSCFVCNKKLDTANSLRRHLPSHDDEITDTCKMCHEEEERKLSERKVNVHMGCSDVDAPSSSKTSDDAITSFSVEKYLTGDVPTRTFMNCRNFGDHLRRHARQRSIECKMCGKKFVHDSLLNVHMRTHTKAKLHECNVCQKKFKLAYILKIHKRTHTGETPFHCDACDERFRLLTDLINHKQGHTGDEPFHCDECDEKFSESDDLDLHKLMHETSEYIVYDAE